MTPTTPADASPTGIKAEIAQHTIEFVARWAWRGPSNPTRDLTDAERLSAIKYHPVVKAAWDGKPADASPAAGEVVAWRSTANFRWDYDSEPPRRVERPQSEIMATPADEWHATTRFCTHPDDYLDALVRQSVLNTSRAETDAMRAERDEANANVFVPGEFCCPKCGFFLSQFKLRASDGAIGDRDEPGEHCPNDGSPLWRVTWKQRASEHYARAVEELTRAQALEAENADLKAKLEKRQIVPAPPMSDELKSIIRLREGVQFKAVDIGIGKKAHNAAQYATRAGYATKLKRGLFRRTTLAAIGETK